MSRKKYNINCTGDVVAGDAIVYEEAVFGGTWKKPKFRGNRKIWAEVTKDSYGQKKQQHTFTLKVLKSTGVDPIQKNSVIRRKGRNVYKNGTYRIKWLNEKEREISAKEKHSRGDKARKTREIRISGWVVLLVVVLRLKGVPKL